MHVPTPPPFAIVEVVETRHRAHATPRNVTARQLTERSEPAVAHGAPAHRHSAKLEVQMVMAPKSGIHMKSADEGYIPRVQ